MVANVPWYFPTLTDEVLVGYAGPFANEEARDAYASDFVASVPASETLGTAFQAVANPSNMLPHATARVALQGGEVEMWSDGTTKTF